MSISEKLKTVAENMERVYEAGCREGTATCEAKHYAAVVYGDGTQQLTFSLPFEPDMLYIFTNEPDIRTQVAVSAYIEIDFACFGLLAGKVGVTSGSNGTGVYANLLKSNSTVVSMYTRGSDGTVTIQNAGYSNINGGDYVFGDGVPYVVLAVKSEMKDLKTRMTESVRRLTDTKCVAYYQTHKKNAAFTDEEWAALIAEKPLCTFNMV